MIGYIYNNPRLAYEGDGYWCFDFDNTSYHFCNEGGIFGCYKKPHEYWCILHEMKDGLMLMAPLFFDVMDNLSNDVIDIGTMQLSDGNMNVTVGIGRVVYREKSKLTTEPVMYINPYKVKEVYNTLIRNLRLKN